MSKRTQLKFKKLLKKAEFVNADLEYHEELLDDAKLEFNEEFTNIINSFSRMKQRAWDRHVKKIKDARLQELLEEQLKGQEDTSQEGSNGENQVTKANKEMMYTEEHPEGFYLNPDELDDEFADEKAGTNKKLYRKIAAKTHPDKLAATNLDSDEVKRKRLMFQKAKKAYENENWYDLYSLALDLGIDPGKVENKHIEWLEQDIRFALGKISQMGQLFAWVWYVGDEETRKRVMAQYFQQVYNWDDI